MRRVIGEVRRWWLGATSLEVLRLGLATAVILALLVDAAQGAAGPGGLLGLALEAVATAIAVIALWNPWRGALLGLLVIAAEIWWPTNASSFMVASLTLALVVTFESWRRVAFVLIVQALLWVPVFILDPGGFTPASAVVIAVLTSLSAGLGWLARWQVRLRESSLDRLTTLTSTRALVRDTERARLAHDLHDAVARELSLISLQVLAVSGSTDTDRLRDSLRAIDEACARALTALRHVGGVLRSDGDPEGRGLVGPLTVDEALEQSRATLADNGFGVDFAPRPTSLALEPTTERMVARLIDEISTNALRYADRSAPVELTLWVDEDWLHVHTRNQVVAGGRSDAPSLHLGLSAMRHQVELIGGAVHRHLTDSQWSLAANVPLRPRPTPAPVAPPDRAHPSRLWLARALTAALLVACRLLAGNLYSLPHPMESLLWVGVSAMIVWSVQPGRLRLVLPPVLVGTVALLAAVGGASGAPLQVLPAVAIVTVTASLGARTAALHALAVGTLLYPLLLRSLSAAPERTLLEAYLTMLVVFVVLPGGIGLAVRRALRRARDRSRRLADLTAETRTIRDDERRLLAGEVTDIVVHQVSLIRVQIMGHGASADPVVLRRVLTRVQGAAGTALSELRLLVGVLRTSDDALALPHGDPGRDLTRTVQEVTALLDSHDVAVRTEVSLPVEQETDLPASTVRTADRVLREAATNVIRHGAREAVCALVVEPVDGMVRIEVRNELPELAEGDRISARRHSRGLGLSLLALRERVLLEGGTFTVEHTPGFMVRADLPVRPTANQA
ncbi:MAG: hypothetical protein IPM00_10800 [Tetrasphaera sp.]|nr:hypothetical protein [Tetrasphaera sp.]